MPGEHDKFGAPYRPPCQGWPDAKYRYLLGPMWNHFRTGEASVQKYHNITAVPNPICEAYWPARYLPQPWPANVPPYLRPDCTVSVPDRSGAGRADYPGDTGYCDASSTLIPCGPWLKSQFAACAGGDITVDTNCYSIVPGENLSLAVCRKLGFKNVQSRHWWYGRFGFEDTDCRSHAAPASGCGLSVPSTPDTTKYRTLSFTMRYKTGVYDDPGFCAGGTQHVLNDCEWSVSLTVDRYSGVITQNSQSYSWTGPDEGTLKSTVGARIGEHIALCCANTHDSDWNPADTIGTDECAGKVIHHETFTHSNTSLTHAVFDIADHTDFIDYTITVTLSDAYESSDLVLDCIGLLAFWDLNDDATYPWRPDAYTTVAPLVEYDAVLDLIGPLDGGNMEDGTTCFDADWVDPNAALYDGAILGKPLPHPGMIAVIQDGGSNSERLDARIDGDLANQLQRRHVTIQSVKLYDGADNLLYTAISSDYTLDATEGTITFPSGGTVLTTHNPGEDPVGVTGSDYYVVVEYTFPQEVGGHFDYRHETWHYDGATEYRYGTGAWSGNGFAFDPTDSYIPRCATHWTNSSEAQNLPHGAWQQHFVGGLCWMQKWAEITTQRPSQNWFGPCGAQRFEIDATKSECVDSAAGSPPVVTLTTGGGATFTAGNKVVYFDGTNAAYYTVSSVSGDDVHLSAKIADLDADMFAGGALLGVVKWPSAWSICGRVAVASATELSGTVTVNLSEAAPYLVTGDAVDFVDGSDSTTDSNKTVTVISDTQFTFSGSVPTGTYVKSHSAPAYWFNDTNPKGDYLYFTWDINNRDFVADSGLRTHQASHGMPRNVAAFSVTAGCVPFTPCCPSVLCISPNYDAEDPDTIDSFVNGITLGFADFTPDDRYGSAWQATFRQVMDDLWWHPPPHPCSNGVSDDPYESVSACTMVEDLTEADTLPCPADTCDGGGGGGKFYYAHRRVVSARMTVPTWSGSGSAPALPTGVFINYLSLSDLDTAGSPPDGLVAAPPEAVGGLGDTLDQPNIVGYDDAPWRLYIDEQFCVCNNGRFASDYLSDWVICGLIPT